VKALRADGGGLRDRQARESLRRRAGGAPLAAYRNAFATDPVSAFGGIIAFNQPVDAATLEAVSAQFLEVLIAPGYTAERIDVIARSRTCGCWKSRCPRTRLPRNARRKTHRRRLPAAKRGRAQRLRGGSSRRDRESADRHRLAICCSRCGWPSS
jgi:hypothetical protein